jgi:GNAT superfamily N-acetyltransferase
MMADSSWSSVGMSIIFRPPRANELQPAQELVVCSINDLTERHGFRPVATLRPTDFQFFPDELWVAEADGEIVGFALIWVCGDLWFLAELFVAPGYQGGGVGMARTFEHARKAGATIQRLITFTFNIVSQGLYIRHGLLPRLPIYLVGADRDVVMLRRQGELAQLDVITLGVSREKHHHYF